MLTKIIESNLSVNHEGLNLIKAAISKLNMSGMLMGTIIENWNNRIYPSLPKKKIEIKFKPNDDSWKKYFKNPEEENLFFKETAFSLCQQAWLSEKRRYLNLMFLDTVHTIDSENVKEILLLLHDALEYIIKAKTMTMGQRAKNSHLLVELFSQIYEPKYSAEKITELRAKMKEMHYLEPEEIRYFEWLFRDNEPDILRYLDKYYLYPLRYPNDYAVDLKTIKNIAQKHNISHNQIIQTYIDLQLMERHANGHVYIINIPSWFNHEKLEKGRSRWKLDYSHLENKSETFMKAFVETISFVNPANVKARRSLSETDCDIRGLAKHYVATLELVKIILTSMPGQIWQSPKYEKEIYELGELLDAQQQIRMDYKDKRRLRKMAAAKARSSSIS